MNAEEICPDFDVGISHSTDPVELWRSDTDEHDDHSVASRVQTSTDDQEARSTTKQQLARLLDTDAFPLSSSKPVRRQRRRHRRLSRSDSMTAARKSQDKVIPKRLS